MASRVPKEFIKSLQGKDFVLFGGLLELAHQDGLSYTNTEIIQFPSDGNNGTTIVKATVKTSKGEFSAIGDASPASVPNKSIAVHSIRMAETRAIARALRVATNVSMTAFEELGVMEPDKPGKASDAQPQAPDPATAALTSAREALFAVCRQLGMDGRAMAQDLRDRALKPYNQMSVDELEWYTEQLRVELEVASKKK